MKKSLILIGLSVMLFSCSKTKTTSFTATDQTGYTPFTGTITKNQAIGTPAPASGVAVTVEIPNTSLYPLSPTAQGSSVYSGLTDANGNFNISVKTIGGNGINAPVTISNNTSTYDPVAGSQAIFSGTNVNLTFVTGVPVNYNYNMPVSSFVGTTQTGTATVMGKVQILYWQEGPANVFNLNPFPLANQTVYIDFDKDPSTQAVKTYTATTDAAGNFSFSIATTNATGFADQGKIYIHDFSHTQDTLRLGNNWKIGVPGYYNGTSYTIFGLTPASISNGNYMFYNSFNPN